MDEFISEPITPVGGRFDTAAMGRGEPGLPREFVWRGQTYGVAEKLDQWKQSSAEGGRAGGELYLRRHCYKLRMSDGSVWTIYFERQAPHSPDKSGCAKSAKRRWFLYRRS